MGSIEDKRQELINKVPSKDDMTLPFGMQEDCADTETESSVHDDSDSDSSRSCGCCRVRSFADRSSAGRSFGLNFSFWVDEVCSSSESETETSNVTLSGRWPPRDRAKRRHQASKQAESSYWICTGRDTGGGDAKVCKAPPAPPHQLSRLERLHEKMKTTAERMEESMQACDVYGILSEYSNMFKLLNRMKNLGEDLPPAVFICACAALETYCEKMRGACPVGRRNDFRKLGEKVRKGNGPYKVQIRECGHSHLCSSTKNSNPNPSESDRSSSSSDSDSSDASSSDSDVECSITCGRPPLSKRKSTDRERRASKDLESWIHGKPCSHAKEAAKAEMNMLEVAPELELPHFLLCSGKTLAADFSKAHVAAEVRVLAAQELAQPPCCIELVSSKGSMEDSDMLRSYAGDAVTIVVDSKPLLQWMQKQIEFPAPSRCRNTAETEWYDARDFGKQTMTCLGKAASSTVPLLLQKLAEGSELIRARAACTLWKIGADSLCLGANEFFALLIDSNMHVRCAAALTLGKLGEQAVPFVPAIVARLEDAEAHVRAAAAWALGKYAQTAELFVERLGEALKDSDENVRHCALYAIKCLGVTARYSVSEIACLVWGGHVKTRKLAASTLVQSLCPGENSHAVKRAMKKMVEIGSGSFMTGSVYCRGFPQDFFNELRLQQQWCSERRLIVSGLSRRRVHYCRKEDKWESMLEEAVLACALRKQGLDVEEVKLVVDQTHTSCGIAYVTLKRKGDMEKALSGKWSSPESYRRKKMRNTIRVDEALLPRKEHIDISQSANFDQSTPPYTDQQSHSFDFEQ